MKEPREGLTPSWVKSLSDFESVTLAERWAERVEETLEVDETMTSSSSASLLDLVRDPSRADRSLDAGAPTVARLILTAATSERQYQSILFEVQSDFKDDDLHAGTTLKAAAVAVALLALSSSSTGGGGPASSSRAEASASSPVLEIRSFGEDVRSLLEWLTDVLNSKYLTAFLNAVTLGGIVVGFRLIKRGNQLFLRDPEGKEVAVPNQLSEALSALVDLEKTGSN